MKSDEESDWTGAMNTGDGTTWLKGIPFALPDYLREQSEDSSHTSGDDLWMAPCSIGHSKLNLSQSTPESNLNVKSEELLPAEHDSEPAIDGDSSNVKDNT